MSFQTVFDYASQISISKRKKIAQTISRSGSVKATSAGGQFYEFNVSMPDGMRWSEMRGLIERIESLDRINTDVIQINKTGAEYINRYQGDVVDPTNILLEYEGGPTFSIVSQNLGSGFYFRAGDYLQLNTGTVYNVVEDVPSFQSSFNVHRPVKEAIGTYELLAVGSDVSFEVICVEMPTWTIFGYDQVRWSGSFVFVEVV
jgi:hypothetical protein